MRLPGNCLLSCLQIAVAFCNRHEPPMTNSPSIGPSCLTHRWPYEQWHNMRHVVTTRDPGLRSPAAILFLSRVACSDSIAKLFRDCIYGVSHIPQFARYVAKWGIALVSSCETKYLGGYRTNPVERLPHPPPPPEIKASRDMGWGITAMPGGYCLLCCSTPALHKFQSL